MNDPRGRAIQVSQNADDILDRDALQGILGTLVADDTAHRNDNDILSGGEYRDAVPVEQVAARRRQIVMQDFDLCRVARYGRHTVTAVECLVSDQRSELSGSAVNENIE